MSGLNPINLVGQLVDDVVTAITGSDVLGDAAGLAVNMATGNPIGAIQQAMQFIEDMQHTASPAESFRPHAEPAGHPAVACPPRDGSSNPAARAEGAGWGEIPDAPAGVRESLATKLLQILNDVGLSLEDKIALIFGELLGGLDDEIEGKMDSLQQKQAAKERADSGAKGKPVNGGEEVSAADISRLSSELQILMQRRSQMQSLLSNIMGMSHQAAMQTISNIR